MLSCRLLSLLSMLPLLLLLLLLCQSKEELALAGGDA
jgi:hypothetical protein